MSDAGGSSTATAESAVATAESAALTAESATEIAPIAVGVLPALGLFIAAYALGSVSAAYWLARSRGVNLREHGSGNLGATNAGRVLGMWAFVVVFIADVAKGVLPVVAALLLVGADHWHGMTVVAAGAAAVLGHVFPCWHGFRGGKAVATSLGVLVALAPLAAAGAAAIFFVVWVLQRFVGQTASGAVGLASTLAAVSAPIWRLAATDQAWRLPALPGTILVLLLAVVIVVRHRQNLRQLFRGQGRAGAPGLSAADAETKPNG